MNAPPLLWFCFGLFLLWTGLRMWHAYRRQAQAEPRLSVVFGNEQIKSRAIEVLQDAAIYLKMDPVTSEISIAQKNAVLAMSKLESRFQLERTEYNLFVSPRITTRTASQSSANLQNQF